MTDSPTAASQGSSVPQGIDPPPTSVPQGIDPQKVGSWIARTQGVEIADIGYEVLSVGRSNLTFVVTLAGSKRWVLRRPPLGHTGGSAHDVAREGRIMAALDTTDVPVSHVIEIVDDPEVMGVPFVFMDFCAGFPINTAEEWGRIPTERQEATAFGMVDTLAAIHSVDLDAVGLSDLRRPGSLLERQLRRWLSQFENITTRSIPEIAEVHRVLVDRQPPADLSPTGIAHGDYKPNNMIFGPDGTVRAVVDWELTAVGETLTDLGYFIAMLTVPDELTSIWVPRVSDGFPAADALVARYGEVTGASAESLAQVPYYSAFALWKLACIREGVYTRLLTGQMGDLDFDPEEAGAGVESLAQHALTILEKETTR
ncbi:phosphotransferase family protein [Brevibacterium litoralis]|uniref:phosphotransferase family protein n=1 Tax=Brevibacterium litoralis TaxID=3138935 RepID=UPI0032ED0F2E